MDKQVFSRLTGVKFMPVRIHLSNHNSKYYLENLTIPDDGKVLLTNAFFSVLPFNYKCHFDYTFESRFAVAARLKTMFPDAKIIVSTRNPVDWAVSLFSEYRKVMRLNDVSFKEFADSCVGGLKSWIDFYGYVKFLHKNFNDVFHYTYEEFVEHPFDTVDCMCKFIGVDTPEFENVVVSKGIFIDEEREVLRNEACVALSC